MAYNSRKRISPAMESVQAQRKQYEKLKKHKVWSMWVHFDHFWAKMNFLEKLDSNFINYLP